MTKEERQQPDSPHSKEDFKILFFGFGLLIIVGAIVGTI